MTVSNIVSDFLIKYGFRLKPKARAPRSALPFFGALGLVVAQFALLIALWGYFGVSEAPPRLLWAGLSTNTAFIALLLLGARHLVSRESASAAAIAEYLNDGLLFVEGDRIAFANPLARKLLGDREPPISLNNEITQVLDQARHSHTPVLYETTCDGRQRHFLVSKATAPGLGNDREMFVFQDVTFLRENEEAKVNFIGALSHEIKTPITSLSMALAMLERTGFDAELVKIANSDISRLRVLLDDLLNVSRLKIVRNPQSLQKRDTNLTTLTHQMVKGASLAGDQKGVKVAAKILPKGHVLANIDPTKITWVISTLLTDAVRQTPSGQSVAVALSHEGNQAVFEIHYQRRMDSLGPTGHAIVRDIIEAHAGRFISLHLANQQSVFRFSIHAYMTSERPGSRALNNSSTSAKGMGKHEANLTG